MQQSTYVSLNTQAMKLKLNSTTLKDKVERLTNDSQAILTSLQMQEKQGQQLEAQENKGSRDFYNLVNTSEKNLGDIRKKNDELEKKLSKIEIAANKICELKTKLLKKYDTAISSIKPEDQKSTVYDFVEFKAYLNILEDNYSNIEKNILANKLNLTKNSNHCEKLQTLLSSFNIDKLKKNTTKSIEKVTKNIEALANIYLNTSDINQKEIQDFMPQLKLNIENINHKSGILFAYSPPQPGVLKKIAVANDEHTTNAEVVELKFG